VRAADMSDLNGAKSGREEGGGENCKYAKSGEAGNGPKCDIFLNKNNGLQGYGCGGGGKNSAAKLGGRNENGRVWLL